jgi:hypothetical protein
MGAILGDDAVGVAGDSGHIPGGIAGVSSGRLLRTCPFLS